jgi:uncharacterized protein YjbI with pentapeptide repeats
MSKARPFAGKVTLFLPNDNVGARYMGLYDTNDHFSLGRSVDPGPFERFNLYAVEPGVVILQIEFNGALMGEKNGWASKVWSADAAVRFDYPGPGTPISLRVHGGGNTLHENPKKTADGYYLLMSGWGPDQFTQAVVTPSIAAIRSGGRSAVKANFRTVDLGGEDLSGIDFSGADFTMANLAGATLTGCTFAGAILSGVNLSGLNFAKVNLTGAHLEKCVLAKTDFSGATLDDAHLEGADLSGGTVFSSTTTLVGAHLAGAKLYGCDFKGASLRKADLTGCEYSRDGFAKPKLAGCDLTGAVLTGAKGIGGVSFEGVSSIAGAVFAGNDLTATTFGKPPFSNDPNLLVDFSRCRLNYSTLGLQWRYLNLAGAVMIGMPTDLTGLDATGAVLTGFQFPEMTLKRAVFDGAKLAGTNFAGAELSFAQFKGAQLQAQGQAMAAVLTAANLFNADLSGAQLTGADLSYAYLYGLKSTLSGATTVLTNFANAYLTGVDLSSVRDKQMQGATFTGACLANCNCRGTDFSDYQGKSVSMSKACLQGADFSDATLFGTVLVDAAVAGKPGKLQASLKLHGSPLVIPISYQPTTLPESATSADTKCPSRDRGPCTGNKLVSPNAPMDAWPPASLEGVTLAMILGKEPAPALPGEPEDGP